ncbi:unnamed protein product [Rhizophagus irregularis]|nr:unnamed protein product [Rhizophagus irregularis]
MNSKTHFLPSLHSNEKISIMTSTLSVIALVIWLRSTAYTFKEGDLVLFGGKFTLDEKKLMLIIKMACLMDLKVGQTVNI